MFFCFRGDIRLGEKGAEAWEPHWDAQQGGGPEWGRPVLHGYLISMWLCCCHFYIKFIVPQVCFKSQTLSVPFLCLKFFWTCFSLLQYVSWHSFWTLIPVHPKWSLSWYIIICGFDGQNLFLHWRNALNNSMPSHYTNTRKILYNQLSEGITSFCE